VVLECVHIAVLTADAGCTESLHVRMCPTDFAKQTLWMTRTRST
jgi:hypothetical protein